MKNTKTFRLALDLIAQLGYHRMNVSDLLDSGGWISYFFINAFESWVLCLKRCCVSGRIFVAILKAIKEWNSYTTVCWHFLHIINRERRRTPWSWDRKRRGKVRKERWSFLLLVIVWWWSELIAFYSNLNRVDRNPLHVIVSSVA